MEASITGNNVPCLVDTGSMVSLVSERFVNKHINPWGIALQEQMEWLTLKAANALSLPYVWYVELEVHVMDKKLSGCGMLVQRDVPGGEFSKGRIPLLLGINILREILDVQVLLWKFKKTQTPEVSTKLLKVVGNHSLCVHAQSMCEVGVTGAMDVEWSTAELTVALSLKGVTVIPTLVTF